MHAIEVVDLRKTYRGGVEALRGVSFAVRQGEVFGLLGPNGAGKSTTVRILATLTAPSAGSARVAGLDVTREGGLVRRRIGYVAQASGVDLTATGRENLTLQARLFHLPGGEARRRASELLALFGLEEAAERLVRTYSGGMKRRLDVAMGLVHRPQVLFLDEPTTGLDPESRAVMWREVRRLARDGLTLLLTTHYLEEADQLAGRLAIVDGGRVVAEGTPDELKGRVRGDLVSVRLTRPERLADAQALLAGLDGVANVVADGPTLYAHVSHGARAIPALVGALEAAGLPVDEVGSSRPSLDDVYLTATGHAYHEEGSAPAAAPAGGR
jgi:ABC-2 type transport system ATP-binding protein